MLSLNASWIEAFENAQREPILYVTITPVSGTTHKFISGDRNRATIANATIGLVKIEGNAAALDEITRAVTVGNYALTFVDEPEQVGRMRALISGTILKGKKLTLKLGEAALSESNYENMMENCMIDKILRKSPGQIDISVLDATGLMLERTINSFQWPGHPCRVIRNALALRLNSAFIDTNAFDEKDDTATSHFVVCRHHDFNALGEDWVYAIREEAYRTNTDMVPVKMREHLTPAAQLVHGAIISTESGLISFNRYDRAAAADRTFTAYEIAEFQAEDDIFSNLYNDVRVIGLDHEGNPGTYYRGKHAASVTAHAWPGESEHAYELSIPGESSAHTWLNSMTVVKPRSYGPPRSAFDASNTSLYIRFPHWYGFCGTTVEDASGNEIEPPSTPTQQTEHTITADRPAYLLLTTTPIGKSDSSALPYEIVKATAFQYTATTSYRTFTGPAGGPKKFWEWGLFTVTRAQLGTTAQNWTTAEGQSRLYCYDITIAVWLVQRMLDRHSYGCPRISFKVPTRNLDVQLGDTVALAREEYLAYDDDGLLTTTLWEVIEKAPEMFGANPGWRLRCARIRDGSVAALPDVTPEPDAVPVAPSLNYYVDGSTPAEVYVNASGEPYVGPVI